MDDNHQVQCPWCWEQLELYIPPDTNGELVEDCEVCCRPWVIYVHRAINGSANIQVERGN